MNQPAAEGWIPGHYEVADASQVGADCVCEEDVLGKGEGPESEEWGMMFDDFESPPDDFHSKGSEMEDIGDMPEWDMDWEYHGMYGLVEEGGCQAHNVTQIGRDEIPADCNVARSDAEVEEAKQGSEQLVIEDGYETTTSRLEVEELKCVTSYEDGWEEWGDEEMEEHFLSMEGSGLVKEMEVSPDWGALDMENNQIAHHNSGWEGLAQQSSGEGLCYGQVGKEGMVVTDVTHTDDPAMGEAQINLVAPNIGIGKNWGRELNLPTTFERDQMQTYNGRDNVQMNFEVERLIETKGTSQIWMVQISQFKEMQREG